MFGKLVVSSTYMTVANILVHISTEGLEKVLDDLRTAVPKEKIPVDLLGNQRAWDAMLATLRIVNGSLNKEEKDKFESGDEDKPF
jgi:hypothetical protein